ncbi:MAG: protein-L-isoaspartate(D-aspartate) O-methyltransferase [Bacteroidota bacterium]
MKDTYRHRGLRRQLIEQIRQRGIRDERVLSAIQRVPRHFFLEKAFEEWAYQDRAFPIGKQQTISQPYTVAYQTELLEVEPREKVLEIGTGSGYQAAILAVLGARVYTVERQELLFQRAGQLLQQLGLGGVRTYFRDGTKGLPEFAPFERIIVTAGSPEIPEQLKTQLKVGGKMVVPVGTPDGQRMYRITRLAEDHYAEETFARFRFVPFLGGLSREEPSS